MKHNKITRDTLKAMRATLKEYKKKTHMFDKDYCKMCALVGGACDKCIFKVHNYDNGCLVRHCVGGASEEMDTKATNRIIEYYTRIIEYVDTHGIESEENYTPNSIMGIALNKIDNEVYNIFELLDTIKNKGWIKALVATRREYILYTHELSWSTCKLCDKAGDNCDTCIMNTYNRPIPPSCTARQCAAGNSTVLSMNEREMLIEYFNKVINMASVTSRRGKHLKHFNKLMVQIDTEVFNKYNSK